MSTIALNTSADQGKTGVLLVAKANDRVLEKLAKDEKLRSEHQRRLGYEHLTPKVRMQIEAYWTSSRNHIEASESYT